jgi:hypothetical protein
MAEFTLKIDTLPVPEQFSGDPCTNCKTEIFGEGFRIVTMIQNTSVIVPNFKESQIKLCSSCKEQWTSDSSS